MTRLWLILRWPMYAVAIVGFLAWLGIVEG